MDQLTGITQNLGPGYDTVNTQLQNIQNQFDAGYGSEPQSAWSPEVIQSKLEATPGYQFRLNQGMQALERSAAARGNLLSGNTLAAAQEFGQGLASQEYQNRLNQLQRTVATQAPGINQQAGLLQGMGSQISQTGQQLGAAAGDIHRGIAEAGQRSGELGGQGLLQSSALQGQLSSQGALTNAQLAQQAGIINAQLAQQANLANQQSSGNTAGLLAQILSQR